MFCVYCGKEIDDTAAFCPECGKPTRAGSAGQSQQTAGSRQQDGPGWQPYTAQQGAQAPYQPAAGQANPDGYAIASLVLGILGLFLLPLIGGILAIVFSNISRRNIGPTTMAKVGKVLGIIAVVLGAVVIFFIILFVVILGVGLMSLY